MSWEEGTTDDVLDAFLRRLARERGRAFATRIRLIVERGRRKRLRNYLERSGGEADPIAYLDSIVERYDRLQPELALLQEQHGEATEAAWTRLLGVIHALIYYRLQQTGFDPGQRTFETAGEYVTEVALAVYSSHFPYDVDFAPWLTIIVRNVCANRAKEARRRAGDLSWEGLHEDGRPERSLELMEWTARRVVEAQLDQKELLSGLSCEEHRQVVQLRVIEGLGCQETADIMGVPKERVYNLKHAALKELARVGE
jgi:RNA polymerase sigma factor (sigma-70 family)